MSLNSMLFLNPKSNPPSPLPAPPATNLVRQSSSSPSSFYHYELLNYYYYFMLYLVLEKIFRGKKKSIDQLMSEPNIQLYVFSDYSFKVFLYRQENICNPYCNGILMLMRKGSLESTRQAFRSR